MIDNCNYAIDHRLQPIHIMKEVIQNRGMILKRIEIHIFHKVIILEGKNITGEDIIDHTVTNNTHPEANTIIDKRDKINIGTIIRAVTGADLLVEECSSTAGHLDMTKVVSEPDKELKEQSLTRDIQKLTQEIADVDYAPMKNHVFQDSAGQL